MRSPRGRSLLIVGCVVGGLLLVGAGGAATLLAARGELTAAEEAAVRGRDALAGQDLAGAQEAFTVAGGHFARAQERLDTPLLLPGDLVPVVRQNLAAVLAAAEAGELLSQAGVDVTATLEGDVGGVAALAPHEGRMPLEAITRATDAVEQAAERINWAAVLVEEADSPWLIGPVSDAVRQLESQIAVALPLAEGAAALTYQLPTFLGADGPRRYFFGAGNPAELRGAGGFIGAYTILTVEDGRLDFGEFNSITDLPPLPETEELEPPNPDFSDRYDRYGGADFWLNINMTPDFPSAASAIERLYEAVSGERLDGTVVVSPAALAPLLAVTGPTDVPEVGQVDAETVVSVMANEAFGEFASNEERKRALGAVAAGVFERFLQGGAASDPVAAGRALAEAATGGSMLLHATDPAVQQGLEIAGLAGELPAAPGDFLAVVGNNAAANKADFYTERAISYRAALLPGGAVRSRTTITLRNATPTAGEPGHVIGPNVEGFAPGDNETILDVFCAVGCVLEEARRDGEAAGLEAQSELEHPVFSTPVLLHSGQTTDLAYRWSTPGAWVPEAADGRYRLTVRDQATIQPTRLDLAVTLPQGWTFVSASHDVARDGRRLTWSGEVDHTEVFEIKLRRPAVTLAVRELRGWARRPLLVSAR